MYSYSELNAVELSSTKKDYYQIWTELLEVAGKLSERWDPTSTNESDPGIVLLKVLTAIADKLNYAIDANTLEAFMPSAAQEASMRKLCEMLGYNMRYYESATTTAKIVYKGKVFPQVGGANSLITIDQFTNLKDIDGQFNYITLELATIDDSQTSVTVPCMEGELVVCETDSGNVISMQNLDDNHRYYLPEAQVASNGIFISNVLRRGTVGSTEYWEQTDNLNIHPLGTKVYKFGFDSSLGLPYVQFPSDIGTLIADGLQLMFVRTKGVAGNISINTLGKLEKPISWSSSESTGDWQDTTKYSVSNISAAKNGRNPETIDEAYWGYQKTIGTFETLVSCRDYMNKIYLMETSETDTTPLVSNVIVSDIRDDINKAYTLCTLKPDGIEYVNKSRVDDRGNDLISHFDLVLYPFKTVKGLDNIYEYRDSFTYNDRNLFEIKAILDECKSLSHKIVSPADNEIACIKVYFKLDARISTTYKVSALEAKEIEEIAYKAIYSKFNMRYMNFGEELPYETILEAMQDADPRIKNVILDDPKMQISALLKGGNEVILVDGSDSAASEQAAEIYNKLILNNILAGRVALFNYNTSFASALNEEAAYGYEPFYEGNSLDQTIVRRFSEYDPSKLVQETSTLSIESGSRNPQVTEAKGEFAISVKDVSVANPLTLTTNEVIQFRFPSFKTIKTFPAYVNYYANLPDKAQNSMQALPATMQTLKEFFDGGPGLIDRVGNGYWMNYYSVNDLKGNTDNWEKDPANTAPVGKDDRTTAQWSPITSWEEKINSLYTYHADFIKKAELPADPNPNPDGNISSEYTTIVKTYLTELEKKYHMLFIKVDQPNKTRYYSALREKYDNSGNAIAFDNVGNYQNTAENIDHYSIYQATREDSDSDNGSFNIYGGYYYLDLTENNLATFIKWLSDKEDRVPHRIDFEDCEQTFASSVGRNSLKLPWTITKVKEYYNNNNLPSDYTEGRAVIEGVYKVVGTDYSYRAGYLVDSGLTKYRSVTGWDKSFGSVGDYSTVFNNCFVPRLWGSNCTGSGSGHIPHSQKGVGSEAVPAVIPKNSEYQLKSGEFIVFNYSSSEGQADGSAVPVNVYYGPGTLIRPNFDLGDSLAVSGKTKFYKTDNYGPWTKADGSVLATSSIPGMFAFGVHEQVEIREQIKVELDSSNTNIYWELLDEDALVDDNNKIKFPFDESGRYTLQAGEYFYYTDGNKQDIAYYGAGTVITKSPRTPQIEKSRKDNETSAAQINELGLTDTIPWQTLNLAATQAKLVIEEYQYTNLIEGDTLKELDLVDSSITILRNTFVDVKDSVAKYTVGNIDSNLPAVSIIKDGAPLCWQVASKLELNIGATKPQVLHAHLKKGTTEPEPFAIDSINLRGLAPRLTAQADNPVKEDIQFYCPQGTEYKDLALYANRTIQSPSGQAYFTLVDANSITAPQSLSFKVCSTEQLLTSSGETFATNTTTDGFSQLLLKNHKVYKHDGSGEEDFTEGVTGNALTLHAAIPEGYFGLVSFYNQVNKSYELTEDGTWDKPHLIGLRPSLTRTGIGAGSEETTPDSPATLALSRPEAAELSDKIIAAGTSINIAENAAYFKTIGRTEILNTNTGAQAISCDFSASGIEFNVRDAVGTLRLEVVNTKQTQEPSQEKNEIIYFSVYINGVRQNSEDFEVTINEAGPTRKNYPYSVASGESNTFAIAHFDTATNATIKVLKQSEAKNGVCSLVSLSVVDSTTEAGADDTTEPVTASYTITAPPQYAENYIEFLGESSILGYGILCDRGTPNPQSTAYKDATQAYAYKTAELLGVDYSIIGSSGLGVKRGYRPVEALDFYLKQSFYRGSSNGNNISPTFNADKSARVPDLIVIDLGASDFTLGVYNKPDFKTAVENLISGINATYNITEGSRHPNIVWVYGLKSSGYAPYVREQLNALGGEANGYYMLELPQDTSAGAGSPSIAGQSTAAEKLAAFIKTNDLLSQENIRREDPALTIFNYYKSTGDSEVNSWWQRTDEKAVQPYWKNLAINYLAENPTASPMTEAPSTWGGWDVSTGIYHLRPGLNVVCIPNSCAIDIIAPRQSADILYFSTLNLVRFDPGTVTAGNSTTGDLNKSLNPRLGCYEHIKGLNDNEVKSPYADLLAQIRTLDPEYQFLYNAPIGNRSGLELNYFDESDTLRLAKHWFDSGNINNKFVVTEIDADHMTTNNHVTVSKFSRY
jgi:hypothetical protein